MKSIKIYQFGEYTLLDTENGILVFSTMAIVCSDLGIDGVCESILKGAFDKEQLVYITKEEILSEVPTALDNYFSEYFEDGSFEINPEVIAKVETLFNGILEEMNDISGESSVEQPTIH